MTRKPKITDIEETRQGHTCLGRAVTMSVVVKAWKCRKCGEVNLVSVQLPLDTDAEVVRRVCLGDTPFVVFEGDDGLPIRDFVPLVTTLREYGITAEELEDLEALRGKRTSVIKEFCAKYGYPEPNIEEV
jgi:hypothetical protein